MCVGSIKLPSSIFVLVAANVTETISDILCPTEIDCHELSQPDTNMWNMEITEGQIKSNYQPCVFVCPAIRAHVLSFRVHNELKNFSRSVSLPRARPSECHLTIGLQSFQWDFKLNSMAQEIDTRNGCQLSERGESSADPRSR